jgi:putative membrane-bound dehydrogenase-like protein
MLLTVPTWAAVSADRETILKEINAPAGLKVTLFAAPPEVSYPVCLVASPTGEVFVASDPNGSLDQKTGRGKIIRCVDKNGDGAADAFTTFAQVDSPRGMVWDAATRTMYVQHPPVVQALHDDDGDGVCDRTETLVDGIGRELSFRGADHTTNGMQIGIDGWLYIAVGDYGFTKATTRDGKSLQFHGGGVVRVRTDGTGLEIVSRGQRNIYDVAISPMMDLFTRDNTNDGDGWDVRLSHVIPGSNYGYPSLFKNFADEIMPPLADYGGGSPTGSLFIDEPGFPTEIGRTMLTCDWGRNVVYRHPLTPKGATFEAKQETFIEMPRPIDVDVDAQSRMYVASWHNGGFNYSGPSVGYVIRLVDPKFEPLPFVDLKSASADTLLEELTSNSHVHRVAAQREILRRGDAIAFAQRLENIASADGSIRARVAATFTLAQLVPTQARPKLVRVAQHDEMREFALRALGDARDAGHADPAPFTAALSDANPRVRTAAVAGLVRLGKTEIAGAIVPLLADIDPAVRHVAANSLVTLGATKPCFDAFDSAVSPKLVEGAARVLRSIHEPQIVSGLIQRLDSTQDPLRRRAILTALCRLYQREADWDGGWWTTRPDTSGPYYRPVMWEQSDRILATLRRALASTDPQTKEFLLVELLRHKIELKEAEPMLAEAARGDVSFQAKIADLLSTRPSLSQASLDVLSNVATSKDHPVPVRARALSALCRVADDAAVKALSRLDASDVAPELAHVRDEFVHDGRRAEQVPMFESLSRSDDALTRVLAYRVLVSVATSKQSPAPAAQGAEKAIATGWARPSQAASILRAIGKEKAARYADDVKSRLTDANADVKDAAEFAAGRLETAHPPKPGLKKRLITDLSFEQARDAAIKSEGDAKLGAELFTRQGCVACHTVNKNDTPKGPFLGGIAKRYSRAELIESILKPNAKIAQGFESHYFQTKKRERFDGFVVRDGGDEIEIRNAAGVATVIKNADVIRKGTLPTSIMPEGLAANISPEELSSLLAYLESLKAE